MYKWFAYGPADATATPSSLASVKSRMVCLSGAGLPRLSWKRPLNRCSSSNSSNRQAVVPGRKKLQMRKLDGIQDLSRTAWIRHHKKMTLQMFGTFTSDRRQPDTEAGHGLANVGTEKEKRSPRKWLWATVIEDLKANVLTWDEATQLALDGDAVLPDERMHMDELRSKVSNPNSWRAQCWLVACRSSLDRWQHRWLVSPELCVLTCGV